MAYINKVVISNVCEKSHMTFGDSSSFYSFGMTVTEGNHNV